MASSDTMSLQNNTPHPISSTPSQWQELIADKTLEELDSMELAVRAKIEEMQHKRGLEDRIKALERQVSHLTEQVKSMKRSPSDVRIRHNQGDGEGNISKSRRLGMATPALGIKSPSPKPVEHTTAAQPPIFDGVYRCANRFWEVQICDGSFDTVDICEHCGSEHSRPTNYVSEEEGHGSDLDTMFHPGSISQDEESRGSLVDFIDDVESDSFVDYVVASPELSDASRNEGFDVPRRLFEAETDNDDDEDQAVELLNPPKQSLLAPQSKIHNPR